jgi:SAM-dependent methyltransferase
VADLPSEIDTSRPHPARIYDYGLGGKTHFAADREVAERAWKAMPTGRIAARENRAFLGRAVRYLTEEQGIRQFLDIGTGLPTTGAVHEIAQDVAPESHVVYVDNDPLVLAHARALLTSSPEGRTAFLHADLRDPMAILDDQVARDVIDFAKPVALMLVAVLHFIQNEDKPAQLIATLLDALPPGSFLVSSHLTGEHDREAWATIERDYRASGIPAQWRDSDEFARLAFAGLEMVPPGVVLVSEWRPRTTAPRPTPAEVSFYGGVARKA